MVNSVKAQKAPGEDVFKLIPASEEKRLLKKIEENTTRATREETERTLLKFDAETRMGFLAQINQLIDASNKVASDVRKMAKKAGYVGIHAEADMSTTLHYVSDSAKFLFVEQLRDYINIAIKLEERGEESKDTLRYLSKLLAVDPEKPLQLSNMLLERGTNPKGVLMSLSNLPTPSREMYLDRLVSLSKEMVGKDMNPGPIIRYIAELPKQIRDTHVEEILSLSEKLVENGIDPKGSIWAVSLLPRDGSVDIGNVLLSSIDLIANERKDPMDMVLASSSSRMQSADRAKIERIMELAHEGVNKRWMKAEQWWDMEKSMNSLLLYSPENFNRVAEIAVGLLEQKRNPNDLFLLSRSVIQHCPENFDAEIDNIGSLVLNIKPFADALLPIFYRPVEFKDSGFENYVFYKLHQTLQRNPERFPEKLHEVADKVSSGINPELVFKPGAP